jgi:hypothetical protein
MTIEMTSNEIIDFGLGLCMQILELVHSLELDDIKAIRDYAVWCALEQVLGLVGSDVRDSSENIRTMSCGPFDAVAVVDTPLPGFMIDVEILQIVVEVDGASTEVATEQSSVGSEYGGHVNMPFTA